MRKIETIKLDDNEITVKELTVLDLIEMTTGAISKKSPLERFDDLLKRGSDTTREKLMAYAPSELDKLVDKFKEVNASFLKTAKALGMDQAVAAIKEGMKEHFITAFSALSKPDTVS